MIYVYSPGREDPSSGIGPDGNYTKHPEANVNISAQIGGNMNSPGQEFARSTTDGHGCVTFQLPGAGRYRFDAVQRSNHTCDPIGTTVADWNGTAAVRLEMGLSGPCV